MGNINNQYFQNSNGGGRGRRERGECCTHTRFPSSPKTGKRGNPIPQTVLVFGGNDGRRVDDSFRKLIDCLSLLRRRLLRNGGRCPPPSFVPRTRFPLKKERKRSSIMQSLPEICGFLERRKPKRNAASTETQKMDSDHFPG